MYIYIYIYIYIYPWPAKSSIQEHLFGPANKTVASPFGRWLLPPRHHRQKNDTQDVIEFNSGYRNENNKKKRNFWNLFKKND